jgi:integrase
MPKAKFILKEPSSKSETLIYLIYNYQYKRFKYSIAEKINPKYWNPNSQRAKETKQFKEYPEFNSRLNLIATGINTAFRKLLNDGIQPNNENLKKALENELSDHIIHGNKITLYEFIKKHIEESESNKKLGTIKVYNTGFMYLKKYGTSINKAIDFHNITLEFYNQYIKFLTHENNLSVNTVGKHIKTLKSFLNEATERGLNNNLEFRNKRFKKPQEKADTIYLTIDELKKIENLNLSKNKKLDRVRDLFLIGCFTGLRFSDFSQLKPENIITDKSMIQIRTHKTGERVSIPLHPTVKKILKKYNNVAPKSYSNQVMNGYIKDVACLSGLKELTETTITKGGKVEKNTLAKYKLVSTHTARRSFATNIFIAGVPSISIMKITGHKSERTFLQYIRITQEENADKLLTHPFFK